MDKIFSSKNPDIKRAEFDYTNDLKRFNEDNSFMFDPDWLYKKPCMKYPHHYHISKLTGSNNET